MHVVLTILGDGSNTKLTLGTGETLVLGRGIKLPDEQRLNDARVSRNHLRFEFDGNRLKVTDLGSTNGTFLQGHRLPAKTPFKVNNEDEIEIGEHRIRVKFKKSHPKEEPPELEQTQPINLLPSNKYEVLGRIGQGAMGVVYSAKHLLLDRVVAVKVLHAGLTEREEERKNFLREVQLAAKIKSPNVVQILDADQIGSRVYLVMELINGPNAHELRRQGKIPIPKVLKFAEGIASALVKMLDKLLVHRDIKPSNILVDEFGTAKLTDFGIARPIAPKGAEPTGEGVGSRPFVAPEQAMEGKDADERSDIYSLGATLYFLMAGVPPLDIRTNDELLTLLFNEKPIPLIEQVPECPPGLSDLVMQMLEKKPADRPQGPGEVLRRVRQLILEQLPSDKEETVSDLMLP